MKDSILVICDIQPEFKGTTGKYINTVVQWLKENKRRYDEIHVLEYEDNGATPAYILNEISDCYHHIHAKDQNDGSYAISKMMPRLNRDDYHFDGIGLYLDYCLYSTMVGLKEIASKDSTFNVFTELCVASDMTMDELKHYYSVQGIKMTGNKVHQNVFGKSKRIKR